MASTTNSNNPYTQPKSAAQATRSLISSDTTSTSSDNTSSNYETAAANATKNDRIPATTAGSVAASVTDRPGMQRQQSWKMSDFKGQQQGQLVAGRAAGAGYSSTGGR